MNIREKWQKTQLDNLITEIGFSRLIMYLSDLCESRAQMYAIIGPSGAQRWQRRAYQLQQLIPTEER